MRATQVTKVSFAGDRAQDYTGSMKSWLILLLTFLSVNAMAMPFASAGHRHVQAGANMPHAMHNRSAVSDCTPMMDDKAGCDMLPCHCCVGKPSVGWNAAWAHRPAYKSLPQHMFLALGDAPPSPPPRF
ncbi:MAG: hypothetical protein WBO55_10800 [Rhizobiaceae bacterium]